MHIRDFLQMVYGKQKVKQGSATLRLARQKNLLLLLALSLFSLTVHGATPSGNLDWNQPTVIQIF